MYFAYLLSLYNEYITNPEKVFKKHLTPKGAFMIGVMPIITSLVLYRKQKLLSTGIYTRMTQEISDEDLLEFYIKFRQVK